MFFLRFYQYDSEGLLVQMLSKNINYKTIELAVTAAKAAMNQYDRIQLVHVVPVGVDHATTVVKRDKSRIKTDFNF